jgi:hypothetical protein
LSGHRRHVLDDGGVGPSRLPFGEITRDSSAEADDAVTAEQ